MESVLILKISWDLCTIDWNAIAAIVSFIMVILTAVSLSQSKGQLEEMRRQWKEQNTPVIACSLEKSQDDLLLVIYNSSQVPVHKLKVELTNNTGEEIFRFAETNALLSEMKFEIPPFQSKQIPVFITPFVDGDYQGYISVKLTYDNKVEVFDLYLKEINLTRWQYSNREICKCIERVGDKLDNLK